jgi:hypothetical protein
MVAERPTTISELIEQLLDLSSDLGAETPVEFAICDGEDSLQFVREVDVEPSAFLPQDSATPPRQFVLIRAHAHGEPHPWSGRGVAADVDQELHRLTGEEPEE